MIRYILGLKEIVGSLDPFNEEERLLEEYRGACYLLAKPRDIGKCSYMFGTLAEMGAVTCTHLPLNVMNLAI